MNHYILKEKTHNLNHEQVVELIHQNFETFMTIINEQHNDTDLMENLIIFNN